MAERPLYYRLEQGIAVPCAREQHGYARVGFALLPGDVTVSTGFWGLDMAREGEPILFETMVFGGLYDHWAWRSRTWDEAAAFHDRVVRALAAGPSGPLAEALPLPDDIGE